MIKNLKSFFTKATSAIVFTAATCLCEPAQAITSQLASVCKEMDCANIPTGVTVMTNTTSCIDQQASYKCYSETENKNGISITVYHKVASCTSCPAYATTVEKQYSGCETVFPAVTYTECGCGTKCDSCNTGTGDWIGSSGTYCDPLSEICPEATPTAGYEGQGIKTCSLTTQCTCTRKSNYRCAKGYYGSSAQCTRQTVGSYCSGCTTCGTNATTAAAGASTIVQCYIPANVNITDDTGTYHFKADCQYSM